MRAGSCAGRDAEEAVLRVGCVRERLLERERGPRLVLRLHGLDLDALTLGQRLVTLHRNRGEVDEDVLPLWPLDEAIALLVREPLHGALSQLFLLLQRETTARAPSRRP